MGMKFDLIGIIVADIEASLKFYRFLDIEIPAPDPDEDHVEVTLPNGLRIAWDSLALMKQIDPDWVEPKGTRTGLAFLCESPTEVDAAYARIIEAGYTGKSEPWDAFWGQRYAQVVDPDGNVIDLFAPLG